MAKLVWGFPGIGKSIASDGEHIIDVDCNLFQFQGVTEADLHTKKGNFLPDKAYPGNYISHLKSLPEDVIALVNCHISYLTEFPDTLVIYPDKSLKEEYLSRYRERGNHDSFIDHMELEFDAMINALDNSPYRKIKILMKDTYLDDILKNGGFYTMFMTKQEMMEVLLHAKDLYESAEYIDLHCNFLDTYKLNEIQDVDGFCMKLFNGEVTLDMQALTSDLSRTEAVIAKEIALKQKRGGLSREALADKIMDGIINGSLGIYYSEISPYAHGYEVTYKRDAIPGSTRDFTNRWECYCDFFKIGSTIVGMIENDAQSNEVFGKRCEPLDIKDMLSYIDEKEANKLTAFTPENETDFKRAIDRNTYPYRNDGATVMDVHKGKGLDGIVLHHYHGDYSTMTPVKQNQLVEMLCALKGFCLDAINTLDCSDKEKDHIIAYLKKKGTDISTTEKLKEWMEKHPDRCVFPHNRNKGKSLDAILQSAKAEQVDQVAKNTTSKEPAIKDKKMEDLGL